MAQHWKSSYWVSKPGLQIGEFDCHNPNMCFSGAWVIWAWITEDRKGSWGHLGRRGGGVTRSEQKKESSDFPSSSCNHARCSLLKTHCLRPTHRGCKDTGVIKHHFGVFFCFPSQPTAFRKKIYNFISGLRRAKLGDRSAVRLPALHTFFTLQSCFWHKCMQFIDTVINVLLFITELILSMLNSL